MSENRSAPRRSLAVALLLTLVLLLSAPDLLWVWKARTIESIVEGLIVPGSLLLIVFAIFGRRMWLACVLLSPFAMLAPAETFYVFTYGHPSNEQVIASIFATNIRETIEYFDDSIISLCAGVLLALTLALAAAWLCWRSNLVWQNSWRNRVLLIGLGAPLAMIAVSFVTTSGDANQRLHSAKVSMLTLADASESGYPFGVPRRLLRYASAWDAMYASVAAHAKFRFDAVRSTRPGVRQVYVLVIGESSRRDHWQLFGYDRRTNPELSRIDNLIPITNMVTSWPTSITAIPLILTRKPITSTAMSWGEASILRALGEAGFETWWISNQMPLGQYDSPVAVYALEAQHYMFLNHATFASSGGYDDVLLRPLRDVVQKSKADAFVVLHMMGSHLRYDGRYPSSYKHFNPIFSDQSTSVIDGERIRNSYDNTILYTDSVLARAIAILKESDAITALFFESDHGETLPTPTCSQAGHGVGSRYDFEIPAFFWYSNSFANAYPKRVENLRKNATQPSLSANTFESLIDMTGTTFPDRSPSWSLFSDSWQPHQRFAHPLEQVDFDTAQPGGACGMLMPPKATAENK